MMTRRAYWPIYRRGRTRGFAPLAITLQGRRIMQLAHAPKTAWGQRRMTSLRQRKPVRIGKTWVLR